MAGDAIPTLGDAFEALLGAIYLDSDLQTVRRFILEEMKDDLEQLEEEPLEVNPKGQLQELLQAISPRSPSYELTSQHGREHERVFRFGSSGKIRSSVPAVGRSKKQAGKRRRAGCAQRAAFGSRKMIPTLPLTTL